MIVLLRCFLLFLFTVACSQNDTGGGETSSKKDKNKTKNGSQVNQKKKNGNTNKNTGNGQGGKDTTTDPNKENENNQENHSNDGGEQTTPEVPENPPIPSGKPKTVEEVKQLPFHTGTFVEGPYEENEYPHYTFYKFQILGDGNCYVRMMLGKILASACGPSALQQRFDELLATITELKSQYLEIFPSEGSSFDKAISILKDFRKSPRKTSKNEQDLIIKLLRGASYAFFVKEFREFLTSPFDR